MSTVEILGLVALAMAALVVGFAYLYAMFAFWNAVIDFVEKSVLPRIKSLFNRRLS